MYYKLIRLHEDGQVVSGILRYSENELDRLVEMLEDLKPVHFEFCIALVVE